MRVELGVVREEVFATACPEAVAFCEDAAEAFSCAAFFLLKSLTTLATYARVS